MHQRSVLPAACRLALLLATGVVLGLLCGLLFAFHPTLAHAATFAVAPTGSDSAPCSEAQPCKSFATALPLLRPGDTLLLKEGVFTQNLKIGNPPVTSGTAAQPITVRGQPGAVIKPTGVEGATINGNTQHWVLEDLAFDCSQLSHATSSVYCLSINWRSGPMNAPQATSFITLRRLTLSNASNPLGANSLGLGVSANDNLIEDITIDGTHLQPGDRQGSHGIYLSGSRNRVVGGSVRNVGGCGVQFNDSNEGAHENRGNQVLGMWLEANGNRTTAGGACGLTVYHNMQETRVVGNVIVGNRGAGLLHEGRNNVGSVVAHNTIVGSSGPCFTGGSDTNHPSTATTLQNNICHHNGAGVRFGPYADGAVVANILSDQSAPELGGMAQSANLVGVDPLFVGGGNYHLQPTSPGCNAGQPILGVTRDRLGRGTGRTPDMGRYPCGDGPTPPTPPTGTTLLCVGRVEAVPGRAVMVCTPQEERR